MSQFDNEQKTGLLLASVDDDEEADGEHLPMTHSRKVKNYENEHFPVIKNRPKTYQRHRTTLNHPVSYFILLLSAFLVGCIAGVVIMLYRMSQDAQIINDSSSLIKIDRTIQTKLFKSINKDNFLSWNRSVESEHEIANRLEKQWNSFSTVFNRVEKVSFDLTLSKFSSSGQWSGIRVLNSDDEKDLIKISAVINDEYLTLASLIKSGSIDGNALFYLNYGRPEDLSYLMEKNLIDWSANQRKIALMRRKSPMISITDQVRQAIRYRFSALILFDDENEEKDPLESDFNHRLTLSQEWNRFTSKKDRQSLLDGKISNDDDEEEDNQIVLLILSKSDVEKIFESLKVESHQWLSLPSHWNDQSSTRKLGGSLKKTTLRITSQTQEIPLQLPNLFGFIRGSINNEDFILLSYQLKNKQQEKVIEQILQSFQTAIQSGWHPRRSILVAGWSGLSYDRYSVRRWMKSYSPLLDQHLIAVIDLGQGILGNSTLNLHGSALFEQIAKKAADAVISPLKHDHVCHKRHNPVMSSTPTENSHHHSRRHSDEHEQHSMNRDHEEEPSECEQHKLYDEWIRASQNRLKKNETWNLVQMMDLQSTAALFQLQQGIPSLIIEMTEENFIINETFYQKRLLADSHSHIQPEIFVAYTQFVLEVIRQLSDEPLIPFHLNSYADLIDHQAKEYLHRYQGAYHSLSSHLGEPNELSTMINELGTTIRTVQSQIEKSSLNRLDILERLNQKLIQFERLFIVNDGKDSFDQQSKHLLFGAAFGLTNTIVPFPSLSNLFFDASSDFRMELIDTLKLHWSTFKEHLQLIERTLKGFEAFRSQ